MTTFQVERLADVRAEAWPLLLRNAEESGVARFGLAHDPDWDKFLAMEAMGLFWVVTVRAGGGAAGGTADVAAGGAAGGGALIGYAAFLVSHSLHARTVKVAMCDTMWVAPEHRRSTIGRQLIRWCEARFTADGCSLIVIAVKPFNGVFQLLERMGYAEAETAYMKQLVAAGG